MKTEAVDTPAGSPRHPFHLDPQMALILRRMLALQGGSPKTWEGSVPELRQRAREEYKYWNAAPPAIPRVADLAAVGAFGPSTVRLYDPIGADVTKPGLIYFHGGGWVIGDLDLEDTALRVLARESGVAILSVDYALAPEHPFPAPLEDCVAVSSWIRTHANRFGVDAERLGLGGASAGANLALASALELRASDTRWVRSLLLMYGAFSPPNDSPSYRQFGDGSYGLSTSQLEYFWSLYVPNAAGRQDPRAAPSRAILSGLPPVFMTVAALDPLRDDSLRLADDFTKAGVLVDCRVYPGVIHGFTLLARELDAAMRALQEAGAALRASLS